MDVLYLIGKKENSIQSNRASETSMQTLLSESSKLQNSQMPWKSKSAIKQQTHNFDRCNKLLEKIKEAANKTQHKHLELKIVEKNRQMMKKP